jgi:hypothetical protein
LAGNGLGEFPGFPHCDIMWGYRFFFCGEFNFLVRRVQSDDTQFLSGAQEVFLTLPKNQTTEEGT